MAKVKRATVIDTLKFTPHQQLVMLRLADESDFDYLPGKYIIVDTKLPASVAGKTIKRAYSIIKFESGVMTLAAQSIPGGLGSQYMNNLSLDDLVEFSGPWGKFTYDENHKDKETILMATDSGVNSILGLLQQTKLRDKAKTLIWFKPASEYLSENYIREQLPPGLKLISSSLPVPENEEQRRLSAQSFFESFKDEFGDDHAYYCCGDGVVISELMAYLKNENMNPSDFKSEFYFRKPQTP